jgi:thiol-disulfide isomerase/thioredoxin
MKTFLSWIMAGALLTTHSYATTTLVLKDFKTQIFHGDSTHPNIWAIEISPPAGHHFNLEAPRSAQLEKFNFDLVQESLNHLMFQSTQRSIRSGSVVEVSAFLCDEKKTYCMKKKMFVTLDDQKSQVITEKFSAKKEAKIASVPEAPLASSAAFIDNDSVRAILIAKTVKKPILIDFYGIWCPPCNLYNETIFNTKEFAEVAKKFVLLKMDADGEKSWELKSKFKVGGYPTLVLAKLSPNGTLEEVERIVGYYPPREFYSRLDQALLHLNDTPDVRWKGRFEELLSSLLDQKNFDEIIKLTQMIKEPKYALYHWIAEIKKSEEFLKDPKNIEKVKNTLDAIAKNIQTQSATTLMHAVDLLSDEVWLKQDQYYKMANELIDQLAKRIDPNTLFVKGSELTMPDLESMRMGLAETIHRDQEVTEIRKRAIESYEKLISFFANHGSKDLRSMNLEYAYLLWKDGRVEQAKKLYSQFIRKFPAEFTFYYAASKMYLTLRDLKEARAMAEKALTYSYGDNRIRAMERLVSVMAEQGLKFDAVLRGNEFLKTVKNPEGLNVRTGRYIESLKSTIIKIEKSANEETKKPEEVKK